MIYSSICIGNQHKEKLLTAARYMNISVKELLMLLLQRSRNIMGKKPQLFHTVKYQRFAGEHPVIMHIEINEIDYEYAVAMRYVYKISVSFLVRLGIDNLMQDIIAEYNKGQKENISEKDYVSTNFFKDAYVVRGYSIDHTLSQGFEHWKLNWDR